MFASQGVSREGIAARGEPSASRCSPKHHAIALTCPSQAPQAAEVGEIERLHQAASAIQRAWRAHCTRKMMDQTSATDSGALARSAAMSMADFGRRAAPRRLDSMLAAVETVEGAAETISEHEGACWLA